MRGDVDEKNLGCCTIDLNHPSKRAAPQCNRRAWTVTVDLPHQDYEHSALSTHDTSFLLIEPPSLKISG